MPPRPEAWPIQDLPLEHLSPDPLTGFALDPVPEPLSASIRQLGCTAPLIAAPGTEEWPFRVVGGHRRLSVLRGLGAATAPVRLAPAPVTGEDAVWIALQDNRPHRCYSDIEIGRALVRFAGAGLSESLLIDRVLPLLGQEPAKKRLQDFLAVGRFAEPLQRTLHDLGLPLRVFSILYRWDEPARAAVRNLLETLRPGVNKCRDLLELIDEIAGRESLGPAQVLEHETLQAALNTPGASAGDRYAAVHQVLFRRRYPHLSQLRSEVRRALESLKLDSRLKVRVPGQFETSELKVEFTFESKEGFTRSVEQLFRLTDSEALERLVQLIQKFR